MKHQSQYLLQRQQLKLKGSSRMANPGGESKKEKPEEEGEEPEKDSAKNKPSKKVGPKPKIKQASKKRAKQNRQYTPVRKKFLRENPVCELRLEGCTGVATQIHHSAGREGNRLLKIDDFKGACDNCHRIVTDKSREAIAEGHSKTRLGKPNKS